ncbi:MAG TPA: protein kinase, partial [Humisphaera sp.]|nr:protein kinase [Humisphaera sp.]
MDRPNEPVNSAAETLDGRAGAGAERHADMPSLGRKITAAVSEGPGSRVGRYKLIQKLGEGGFGIVFQAEQERPVRRTVALKIIKLGMDTHAVIARFDGERQALAMMDHPNIAKVLDAGTTDSGRPYFVMEYVRGVPITEFCDANELSAKERLALFNAVCLAVQHAHQKGIIHRDLKPSNILIALQDGEPVPKVIDFGIAKATSGRLTDMTVQTELHEMIGTPQYMSPEQAEMATLDIDTRTDIYSLGVVLFELLTGGTPLDAQTLRTAALLEIQRMIREAEPPRPSVKLASLGKAAVMIAIRRNTDVKRLAQQLRGELDWIVLKAMEKDRARRYDTAQGLALDVQRYLNDEPVLARPASAMYRTQKFVRKHKAAVITAAVVVLALVLGIAGTTIGMAKARRASATAIAAERVATEKKNQVVGLLAEVKKQTQNLEQANSVAEKAKILAEQTAEVAKTEARNAKIGEARGDIHRADTMAAAERVSEASALYKKGRKELEDLGLSLMPADLGQWDLTRRSPPPLWSNRTQAKESGDIESVALGGDQKTVVAMAGNGHVDVWDLRHGFHIRGFETNESKWLRGALAFAVSPDGRLLATGRPDLSIHLFDIESGLLVRDLAPLKKVAATASFSRDGRRLFVAPNNGELGIYEVASGKQVKVVDGNGQFYPDVDGRRAILLHGGSAELWDLETEKPIRRVSAPSMQSGGPRVVFSSDGHTALFGDSSSGVVWCWNDVDKDTSLIDFAGRHATGISAMTLTWDGLTLVSVGVEGDVKLWDVAGRRLRRTIGRGGQGISIAQSEDGAIAVTGDWSRTINVWPLKPGRESRIIDIPETTIGAVAIFPGARVGVCAGWDFKFRFYDLMTGKRLRMFDDPERKARVKRLFIVDRATRLLAAETLGEDTARIQQLTLWDIDLGTIIARVPLHAFARDAVLSPDGRVVLAQERDADDDSRGAIRAWEVASLREISLDAAAKLSPEMGKLMQRLRAPNAMMPLAISPDASFFVSASFPRWHGCYFDIDLTVFPTADGADRGTEWDPSNQNGFYDAAFSPDGRVIAAGAGDSLVKLFDPVARQEIVSLSGHAGQVKAVAFAPDSTRQMILSAASDRTLRVWDLARQDEYGEFNKRVSAARRTLEKNHNDAPSLRVLGEWYAFRGEWSWATDLLTEARQKGEPVSPLLMARCDWMQNDLPGAEREFVAAIAKDEAAVDYLKQCLKAVRQEMTQTVEWRQKVDEAIKLPPKPRMAAIAELLQQKPYDAELHAQRAVLFADGGHFAEAGADFDRALDIQENTTWRFGRACIRLYLGDQKGYLEDCQVMYNRSIYIDNHNLSNQACKTCLLQAGAVADTGRIVEIIDRHIKA